MKDLKYRYNGNNHFNEKVYHDTIRLMDRYMTFYDYHRSLPTDDEMMRYFGWTKDHLNRCYQMLKELGVVDYARNHRRTTLRFLGDYEGLNALIRIKKKDD